MREGFIARGFRGRRKLSDQSGRLPPGQYLERGFPVLSAGPTPHTPLANWDFSIIGEVDQPKRWTWEEFRALPRETVTKDIHCVTKWSKFDTLWEGVSLDTLLAQVTTAASYVIAFSDGGYTTNLPLDEVTGGQACWCLTSTSGRAPSGFEAYAWLTTMNQASGSPWATIITVIHGKKNATGENELADREHHATRSRPCALSYGVITDHLHHKTGESVFDASW